MVPIALRPAVPDDAVMNQHQRTHRSTVRFALASAALGGSALLTGCLPAGLGGPSFAVGDCVTVEQRLVDSDLDDASCGEAVGTFDPEARTYRVDSIIDNTDGGCPMGTGFFPVEFVHEPDGVTYCLVQEDGY